MVIEPYHHTGIITYDTDKKRWKQKGGNLYLKIFAQEGLGRPDIEIKNHKNDIKKFFEANLPDQVIPETDTILVFTNEKVEVQTESPSEVTLTAKKLKEFVRKKGKQALIPVSVISLINEGLGGE
ncbi:MAG: hypothetical protein MUO76_12605 [Anaerolineaceae bacterium]|nr:hypothetical protein [Anaerolineaceae bacterium]